MRSDVVIALALVIAARPAFACTCLGPRDAASAARAAVAVFAGRAVRERPASGPFGAERVVTFALERVWKGGASETLEVRTAAHTSACGYPFEVGRTYLVFALRDTDGSLGTGACRRTALLSRAARDAVALEEGRAVGEDPGAPPPGLRVRP